MLPGFRRRPHAPALRRLARAGVRRAAARGDLLRDRRARRRDPLHVVKRTRAASLDGAGRTGARPARRHAGALGTTTVEAKSGYGLSFEDELKQLAALRDAAAGHPVERRPDLSRRAHRSRRVPGSREDTSGCSIERMLPEVARQRLAEYADAFVDAHAFSIDEARTVLTAAAEHGLGVRLHADQLADDGAASLAAELGRGLGRPPRVRFARRASRRWPAPAPVASCCRRRPSS